MSGSRVYPRELFERAIREFKPPRLKARWGSDQSDYSPTLPGSPAGAVFYLDYASAPTHVLPMEEPVTLPACSPSRRPRRGSACPTCGLDHLPLRKVGHARALGLFAAFCVAAGSARKGPRAEASFRDDVGHASDVYAPRLP